MRHTRDILWSQLFELPETPGLPLQAQLRAAIVREILAGRLPAGAALPSSRDLARLLRLGRNTVTAAYQQLVADGFLRARARSGVYVAPQAPSQAPPLPTPAAVHEASDDTSAPDWSVRLRRTMRGRPTLSKPEGWREAPYPFVYGGHDPALFPVEDFRECCARTLTRAQLSHWAPDFETEDAPELIEQIRQRVLPKRGVFARPDEIMVTVGAQQAFHLLGEALLDGGTRLGLEEPGYPHARNSFALRQPLELLLPVDNDGLVVDALPPLDLLFVTPSHQAPTTVTMSLARRQALLQQAQAQDFVIIEDDYEADNLHDGAPVPALKSLDRRGRVVYVGSLSKSLSPAMRLGYVVASAALIAELRALRHVMVRHPSAFLQQAYALYLSLGHHESHGRRVNQALRERLAIAAQALREHLPEFGFSMPRGGASLWLQAPPWLDGAQLAQAARAHGVLIEPGDVFFARPPQPCPFVRLRLSSIAPARIAPGIAALARAVQDCARERRRSRDMG